MNPGLSAPLTGRTWLGVKTALDLLGEAEDVFNPSTRQDGGVADGGGGLGVAGSQRQAERPA